MKIRFFAVILLFAASFGFAATLYSTDNSVSTPSSSVYGTDSPSDSVMYRNSFFMKGDMGMILQSLRYWEPLAGSSKSTSMDFEGSGEDVSFGLGLCFRGLFTIQTGFTFAYGTGSLVDDRLNLKFDSDFLKMMFNLGTTVFPFRGVDGLHNLFLGVNFGIGILAVDAEEEFDEDEFYYETLDLSAKLSVGYVWNVFDRVGIGLEFFFNLEYTDSECDYDEGCGDDSANSVGLNLVFMRK